MTLQLAGSLKGHNGWVTSIATTSQNPNMIVSASRDKSLLIWNIEPDASVVGDECDGISYGKPVRSLHGHTHFVEDVVISSDGQYALSGSWDRTLRLWELSTGVTRNRFIGHTKDVLSVAFSPDNRQIISGGRDKTIRIWNTLGHLVHTIDGEKNGAHTDWVSSVAFSPDAKVSRVVSCGWDNMVKVWDMNIVDKKECKLANNLEGHSGYVNCATISPDGSLCASGGKDGIVMLWDLTEGKKLYELDAGSTIYSLVFSPSKYWLCAATEKEIKVLDLENKRCVDVLRPKFRVPKKGFIPYCISLAWSTDGSTLYSGYTDNVIRVWTVKP